MCGGDFRGRRPEDVERERVEVADEAFEREQRRDREAEMTPASAPEQIRLVPGVDPDALIEETKARYQPIRTVCMISGGHDSTVLAHRCRDHYDELVHIDTGTALPGVAEFVEAFAEQLGKPLSIYRTPREAYDRIVLGGRECADGSRSAALGFPGPMQHTRCYVDLKERQIEQMVRDVKTDHPRTAKVLLITGLRRQESKRRSRREPVTVRGAKVFCNPLSDWSGARMRNYRVEHRLPESSVAALMHKSGECNCGAFARPGEREELRSLFPSWFEERIAPVEREAQAMGLPCAVWGTGRDLLDARVVAAEALCTDCQLRFEAV